MTKPETVIIDKTEYERLLKASEKLDALEANGVDNWEGYGEAIRSLNLEDDETEEDIYGE